MEIIENRKIYLVKNSLDDFLIYFTNGIYINTFMDQRPEVNFDVEYYFSVRKTSLPSKYNFSKNYPNGDYKLKYFKKNNCVEIESAEFINIERAYLGNLCKHKRTCEMGLYFYCESLYKFYGGK